MGTVLLSSSVAFAEEPTETEVITEATTEAAEVEAEEIDLGDFEWTEDMVLSFSNGEKTYYINMSNDKLYINTFDMTKTGGEEGGWITEISEDENVDLLYQCVQYFFDYFAPSIDAVFE